MDQSSAQERQNEATPIFGAYRRGYDPDQVDRYVADQQRRLDETTLRASEAERKLAAAVGQLRELHRRVAVLESENRSPQAPPLDSLGERVQRILQEAWEGAYALRQSTEQEMAELRETTAGEAEAIVMTARQRARAIEEEIDRRRTAYIEQLDGERTRAAAQIAYIHRQRDVALGELLQVKATIETTVSEISHGSVLLEEPDAIGTASEDVEEHATVEAPRAEPPQQLRRGVPRGTRPNRSGDAGRAGDGHRPIRVAAVPAPDASELVRNHRAMHAPEASRPPGSRRPGPESPEPAARVFDFEDTDE